MQTSTPDPHKVLSKRFKVRLLCLLAVVALGMVGKMLFFSPLPRGAYPVLSTAGWAGQNPTFPEYTPYQWLPNGDLVHGEIGPHGRLQICYQKMDAKGPIGPVRPGLEMPPEPDLPPAPGFHSSAVFSSPDEQWIACVWYSGATFRKTLLVSADGKTTRMFPQVFVQWLSDSKSFLAVPSQSRRALEVCHLDSPRRESILRTTQNESNLLVSTMTDSPNYLIGGRIIHLPSPGPTASYPSMTLRSFRIAQPDVVQQTWQAQVPKNIEFGTALASPDNRLLLWSCGTYRHTSLSEGLHRLFPARKIVTVVKTNWFLSDLQGKNMHPILEDGIGNDALFLEDDGRTDSPTLSFSWTPDSKHLSFLYKRQLYFVPVD